MGGHQPFSLTPFITAAGVGALSLYWLRPYENPDAVGSGDEYLWVGGHDHSTRKMFRGVSPALDNPPSSWTLFEPPGGLMADSPETPFFVHDTDEASPYRLYFHPSYSESGGSQATRLVSHTGPDWENGVDLGEVLPNDALAGDPTMPHTGYASVEKQAAGDWHAWSLTKANGGIGKFGHWTSTDGETWTCVNPTIDNTSMLPAGRRLELSSLNRFTIGATTYGVCLEMAADFTGGGTVPTGVKVDLFEMPDEETITSVRTIFQASDYEGIADAITDVRAVQDATDPTLIHLYVVINKVTMYHLTHTVT